MPLIRNYSGNNSCYLGHRNNELFSSCSSVVLLLPSISHLWHQASTIYTWYAQQGTILWLCKPSWTVAWCQTSARQKLKSGLQAGKYMQQCRFPNTYCFSKHLAESLMASYHSTAFPVAIVRPSIIGGLAGSPLPGYVGNTAGSTGAALAIATGQLK